MRQHQTLKHFDNHATNGFIEDCEDCNAKIKVLKQVSYSLRKRDVYWRKMYGDLGQ